MTIYQYEKTIYPRVPQGIEMANEMERKLREQGCFLKRREDTQAIVIEAEYHFSIIDEQTGENIDGCNNI